MRHTCFLFIGEEFADLAKGHQKYVLKYASSETSGYLSTLWMKYVHQKYEIYGYQKEVAKEELFGIDIDTEFAVRQEMLRSIDSSANKFIQQVESFLHQLFSERVTLMMPGDGQMSLCIIIPSNANQYLHIIHSISEAISNINLHIDVDVLVYPHLGDVTQEDDNTLLDDDIEQLRNQTEKTINDLKGIERVRQIIMMQDKNQRGISITFNFQNLVAILGEMAIAYAENFNQLFTQTMLLNNRDKITTFGLSQLTFDHYFYVQYLLRLAFLQMFRQENVSQHDIDVNKVAAIAKECLMKHPQLLTEFYKRHVDLEMAGGRSDKAVISQTAEKLDKFIDEVHTDLTAYVDSDQLSLPEKRCVLAMIMGEDDDLITGELYDKELITFLDYYREAVGMFVNYNNGNVIQLNDEEGRPLYDDKGKRKTTGGTLKVSLDDGGHALFDLDGLKRLRLEIRQATTYIRTKEEELAKIGSSQKIEKESDKVVSSDGFNFGGTVYRLIPDEPAKPVNDTYEPHETFTENVNLSPMFTPVKNQGSIGSCSAHAVVAIFEYILKKNGKVECDLSERFVYYNVRRNNDRLHLDDGASMYDVIQSVENEGICLEEFCPYDINRYNEQPTEDAYQDGKRRRALKAMNIPIGDDTEKNINALRSALSEGYPIAFGMRVFDSLKGTDGFVMLPSEDLIASEEKKSNHAMVICGYDDKQKYFLVRNSWGKDFGIDGYCYVPYAYLGDSRLIHGAYIITEVSMEGIEVKGVVGKERFSFNAADNIIKAAVIHNMIISERNRLKRLTAAYHKKRTETEELIQQLATTNVRNDILGDTEHNFGVRIQKAEAKKNQLAERRGIVLAAYEEETSKGYLKLGLTALGLLLVNGIWTYNFWRDEPLNIDTHTYVLSALLMITLLAIFGWKYHRHFGHKHLREDLDEAIDRQGKIIGKLEAERDSLKSRFHVAGMLLTKLFNLEQQLNDFYSSAKSYVNNLSAWNKEECTKQRQMKVELIPPFELVFNQEIVLSYFERHKEKILQGQHLYQFLSNGEYQSGPAAVITFQKRLQKHISDCLENSFKEFCIYDYIMHNKDYPFLPSLDDKTLGRQLANLDANATPFVQMVNATADISCHLLIKHPEGEGNQGPWNDICSKRPIMHVTSTPWSLTMLKIAFAHPTDITLLS